MRRFAFFLSALLLLTLISCDKLGIIRPGKGRPEPPPPTPDSVSAVVLDSASYIVWGDIRLKDTSANPVSVGGFYSFQLAPGSSYPFFGPFVDSAGGLAFGIDGSQLDGQPIAVMAIEPNQTLPCQVVPNGGFVNFPIVQGGPGKYTFVLYDVGKCP